MTTFKFTYFDFQALGEPTRMLFSYGNIKFEDIRIQFKDWPEFKETTPLGQLPLLEVDGKILHQSLAITRFVAKKVGLAGSNDLEAAEIDVAVDTVNEFRDKIARVAYEADASIQEKKRPELESVTIPFYLKKLEQLAKENEGHLALKRTTWADFYFTGMINYLNHIAKTDLTAKNPNLQKVVDNVLAIKSVKEWIEKRPKTDY